MMHKRKLHIPTKLISGQFLRSFVSPELSQTKEY